MNSIEADLTICHNRFDYYIVRHYSTRKGRFVRTAFVYRSYNVRILFVWLNEEPAVNLHNMSPIIHYPGVL